MTTALALLFALLTHAVIFVWGARLFAARFRSPRTRVLLVRAALFAPLVTAPVTLVSPLSAWSIEAPRGTGIVPIAGTGTPAPGHVRIERQGSGIAIADPTTGRRTAITAPTPLWLRALAALWLAGLFIRSIRTCSGWLAARRAVRGATPLPDEVTITLLDGLLRDGDRQPRLLQSDRVRTPMALTGARIVLPSRLLGDLPLDATRVIVAHELAHVRSRDTEWLIGGELVAALLWCVPGLSRLRAGARADAEFAADDWAIARTHRPYTLADALARVATEPSGAIWAAGAATTTPLLVRRLERMLEGRAEAAARPWFAAACIACLTVLALTVVPRVDPPAVRQVSLIGAPGGVQLRLPSGW